MNKTKQTNTYIWLMLLLLMLLVFPFQPLHSDQESGQTDETTRNVSMERHQQVYTLTAYQMVFTTIPLSFVVIHLILFIYFRKSKENLYFAIFLFLYAMNIFTDYQFSLFGNSNDSILLMQFNRVLLSLQWIAALRFVYSIFYKKLPLQFWFLSVVMMVSCVITWVKISPEDLDVHYNYIVRIVFFFWFEIIRVVIKGIREKRDGAKIIAMGFLIHFIFSAFDSLIDNGVTTIFDQMQNPYAIGTIGFLITMSFYLARNYSSTHNLLIEQERLAQEQELEHRLLEADNNRKTKELEEARKLQLGMLPQCVVPPAGLDICFYMNPAEEVGGDYYDYILTDDDTVVLTIGDATGHGMKAGIMVASIKGLFQTIGMNPDIPAFFNKCSATIKQMNMGNLYMAMTVARLKGNKLTLSAAGMPPLLIIREKGGEVEEVLIKGPPLGGFKTFSYILKEVDVFPGDVIVLMSDGLPELFNKEGEMFSYNRVKQILADAPRDTATTVIDYLCHQADKWRSNIKQEDDISLVAVKIK
jgi:serine phosphatase RsbU (regulator of sigma subunit)